MQKYIASSLHKHQASAGTVRELLLIEILRELLPDTYGITSGEIHSGSSRSRQIDIIIFDATKTKGYSIAEDIKIIPGEFVKAIIEVKTKLTKTKLIEALHTIWSAWDAIPPSPNILKRHLRPFSTIFAYEIGKNSLKSISNNLNVLLKDKPGTLVNLIAVLDNGLVHFDHEFSPYFYNSLYNATTYGGFPTSKHTLQRFYQTLQSHLFYG